MFHYLSYQQNVDAILPFITQDQSFIVIANILFATELYDTTKSCLNLSTNSLLSFAQNSKSLVESKIT